MADHVEYVISRVEVPRWVRERGFSSDADAVLGGQIAWHFATPWVFRALASPRTGEPLLRHPNADDPHQHRLAYWTSLLYLAAYRLGWPRPDRGLKWLLESGDSSDDPNVRLIAAAWQRDGTLPMLTHWLTHGNARHLVADFAELCGYSETPGDVHLPLGAHRAEYEYPAGPGGNHLEGRGHLGEPFAPVAAFRHFRSDADRRRAVMVYPTMIGWYRALADFGGTLPDLGNRSWRVDVVVPSVGHLGTYRRSRMSGIWFAGRHSAHIAGT